MNIPLIVIIKDGVVDEIKVSTKEKCEGDFLDAVASRVSNWDEYTDEDKEYITDNGYEITGNGSVCLTWVYDERFELVLTENKNLVE